jgi:hypothetical protein
MEQLMAGTVSTAGSPSKPFLNVPLESPESYQGGIVLPRTQEYMVMKILAIDLGKYKSVACSYVTATGTARFATIVTHVIELDRLLS